MKTAFKISGVNYTADLAQPLDISVPVSFDGDSLTAFGAEPARRETFCNGDFTGDTRRNGSCNCELYTFSPHLHGTHTECVGHITEERIAVHDVMKEGFVPATLITVVPARANESYDPAPHPHDMMITRAAIEKTLNAVEGFLDALIIRTNYNGAPPYFSHEAMKFINHLGVKHLLVDIPSVDRLDDEGKLSNHRIFWGVAPGIKSVPKPSPKTITELIRVPKAVADGAYILNLQVAPFLCDAAPSKPILYEAKR